MIRQAPEPFVYTINKRFLRTNRCDGYPRVFDPAFEPYCQAKTRPHAVTRNDLLEAMRQLNDRAYLLTDHFDEAHHP